MYRGAKFIRYNPEVANGKPGIIDYLDEMRRGYRVTSKALLRTSNQEAWQ